MTSLKIKQALVLQYGGSPNVVAVSSVRDAQGKWNAMRLRLMEDGVEMDDIEKVHVLDMDTFERVARISWNGRAWGMDGKEIL